MASTARSSAKVGPSRSDLVIEETEADAAALGCDTELDRRAIAGAGTSADAQLALFHAHGRTGGRAAALQAVTSWLAAATLE
jgi:hypothetical protein